MSRINLDLIEVPIPCTVPWASMRGGDDRVRHCTECHQNVYHLSNMSRSEAEALIREKEGRLCVQFYRRPDGSVVTRDCAAVRWGRKVVSFVSLTMMAVLSWLFVTRILRDPPANEPFSFVGGTVCPPK